ncbi:hypothetical protein LCGC14_1947660 [marine sediment metagenome]|uniref:Uncharacterized protein n=1 Tax=marine sediment metagenome TaxID=412755 RepID=A0A0F9FIN4_9ZZZZ|nr:hypothetical protein [Phycisphaerae bacterium]
MNEIEKAHRQASQALVALFQEPRTGTAAMAIPQRVDDVLEALATFSATIALQEINHRIQDGQLYVNRVDAAPNPKPPNANP